MTIESRMIYRDSVEYINETVKVLNGKAVLSELPDRFEHVEITGYTEIYTSNYNFIGDTEFVVNYNNGIIHFNPQTVADGTAVTVDYYGRGYVMYPASRIYTETVGGNYMTFQDYVNNAQALLDLLENNGSGVLTVNGHSGAVNLIPSDIGAVSTETFGNGQTVQNTKIEENKTAVTNLSNELTTVKSDLETLRQNMLNDGTVTEGDIAEISNVLTDLDTRLDAAELNITNLKAKDTELSQSIVNTNNKISTVEGNLQKTDQKVAAVETALTGKSPTVHQHVEADITDLDKYTKAEVDQKFIEASTKGADLSAYAKADHQHVVSDISGLSDSIDGKIEESLQSAIRESEFGAAVSAFMTLESLGIAGVPFVENFEANSTSSLKAVKINQVLPSAVYAGTNVSIVLNDVTGLYAGLGIAFYSGETLSDTGAHIVSVNAGTKTIVVNQVTRNYVAGDLLTTFTGEYDLTSGKYVNGSKKTYTGQVDIAQSGILSEVEAEDMSLLEVNGFLFLLVITKESASSRTLHLFKRSQSLGATWIKIGHKALTTVSRFSYAKLYKEEANVGIMMHWKDNVYRTEAIEFTSVSTDKAADSALTFTRLSSNVYYNAESADISGTDNLNTHLLFSGATSDTQAKDVFVYQRDNTLTGAAAWTASKIHTRVTDSTVLTKLDTYQNKIAAFFVDYDSFSAVQKNVYFAFYNGTAWTASKRIFSTLNNVEKYAVSYDANGIHVYLLDTISEEIFHLKSTDSGATWTAYTLDLSGDSISTVKQGEAHKLLVQKTVSGNQVVVKYDPATKGQQTIELAQAFAATNWIKRMEKNHDLPYAAGIKALASGKHSIGTLGISYDNKVTTPYNMSLMTFEVSMQSSERIHDVYMSAEGAGSYQIDVAGYNAGEAQVYTNGVYHDETADIVGRYTPSAAVNKVIVRARFNQEVEMISGIVANIPNYTETLSTIDQTLDTHDGRITQNETDIETLFTNVDDGKALLATAIIDKGSTVANFPATTPSFAELEVGIRAIEGGGTGTGGTGSGDIPAQVTGITIAETDMQGMMIKWLSYEYTADSTTIDGFNVYADGVKLNNTPIKEKFYTISRTEYDKLIAFEFPRIVVRAVSFSGIESIESDVVTPLLGGYNGITTDTSYPIRDEYLRYLSGGSIELNWKSAVNPRTAIGFLIDVYDPNNVKIKEKLSLMYFGNTNNETYYAYLDVINDSPYLDKLLTADIRSAEVSPYLESARSSRLSFMNMRRNGYVWDLTASKAEGITTASWTGNFTFSGTTTVPEGYVIIVQKTDATSGAISYKLAQETTFSETYPSADAMYANLISMSATSMTLDHLVEDETYTLQLFAMAKEADGHYLASSPNEFTFVNDNVETLYMTEGMTFDSTNQDVSIFGFSGTWFVDGTTKTFRSMEINDGQKSETTTEVFATTPLNMVITYDISSEANYDKLYISKNGTYLSSESGIKTNLVTTIPLTTSGANLITLNYMKDGSVSEGTDDARIKSIVITAG